MTADAISTERPPSQLLGVDHQIARGPGLLVNQKVVDVTNQAIGGVNMISTHLLVL